MPAVSPVKAGVQENKAGSRLSPGKRNPMRDRVDGKVYLAVCFICVLGTLSGVGLGVAGNSAVDTDPSEQQSKAARYRDRAEKRVEFNKCYRSGLPECYKQFQEAIDWCNKNWKRCFPLIESAGAHPSIFGGQILRECKKKLKARCREK